MLNLLGTRPVGGGGSRLAPPPRLLPRGVPLHTPVHHLHNTDQPPFIPDLPAGDTGALGDGSSYTSHGLSVPRSSSSSTDSTLSRRGFLGRLFSSFSFFFFLFSRVAREERISSAKRMGPLSGATTTGKMISSAATSGGAWARATSAASCSTPSTPGAASATTASSTS